MEELPLETLQEIHNLVKAHRAEVHCTCDPNVTLETAGLALILGDNGPEVVQVGGIYVRHEFYCGRSN